MKTKKVKASVKVVASNITGMEDCASVQGVRVVGGPKGIIVEKMTIELGMKPKKPLKEKAKVAVKKTIKPGAAVTKK